MTDLLGCPFCGGDAVIEQNGSTRQSNIVACTECGCRLESGDVFDPAGSWNTRPSSSAPVEPTVAQINSACMSFRHDFGLLTESGQQQERFVALEWLRAWQKEGFAILSPPGSSRREKRNECMAAESRLAEAMGILEFYAEPFEYIKKHGLEEQTPDFYDELDTGERARRFLDAGKE